MKCNSEVHLQNKDKVFFFSTSRTLSNTSVQPYPPIFFPKDVEFVRPTAYFLNSGMHHKKKTYSALYHFSLVAFVKHMRVLAFQAKAYFRRHLLGRSISERITYIDQKFHVKSHVSTRRRI